MAKKKLWMSWSTGKDSAYALHALRRNEKYEVTALFTTVTEDYDRVAMHSTRHALLRQQAEVLGLPLEVVLIPANCTNEIFETQMRELIAKAKAASVTAMGFGDLYLADIRQYRERLLEGTGIEPVFPLWEIPTSALAREMLASGVKAVLTCIDPKKLAPAFAGRFYDTKLLSDFPSGIDPCGENGEFHTFVFDAPGFASAIPISVGERVQRGEFVYSDVLPVLQT